MLVNSLLKESIQTKFKINVFMINHPLFLSQNINVFTIFARNLRKIKNNRGNYTKYCEERYCNPDNFEDF